MKNQHDMTPEENHRANMLCILSLFLEVLPYMLLPVGVILNMNGMDEEKLQYFQAVISSLAGLSGIAGFILMIVIRVVYPQNVFGKVLMWIYIAVIILMIILIIAVMVVCTIACGNCLNEMQHCPGFIGVYGLERLWIP